MKRYDNGTFVERWPHVYSWWLHCNGDIRSFTEGAVRESIYPGRLSVYNHAKLNAINAAMRMEASEG